jgi:diguanylate cyclase (GGDEF)-like protein
MERIPTFALLIVRLDGWYQSRAWHGVSTAARLLGVRVVALVGSAFGDPECRGGPSEIYRLAESDRIDGYLPLVGALANLEGRESVLDLMNSLPPKPTVCIGMELPGYASVVPDGSGIDLVVRHLAGAHALRKIYYMGGPSSNPDARRRLTDFVNTMKEYGLEPPPEHLFEGDFSPEPGYAVMADAFDRLGVPQAVVCANDATALGVRRLCRERGIRIPDQMILTGYDDIEEAATMSPPLTTVDAVTYQVAFRSVELLCDLYKGGAPRNEIVPTEVVVRRSCGCRNSASSMHLPKLLADASGVPHTNRIREIISDPDASAAFLDRLEIAFEQADHAELDLWEERLFSASRPYLPEGGADFLLQAQAIISRVRHGVDLNRRQTLQILLREQYSAVQKLVMGFAADDLPHQILEAFQPLRNSHLRILLFNEDGAPLREPRFREMPFQLEIDVSAKRIGPPLFDSLLPSGTLPVSTWLTFSLSLADEHFGIIQVRDWTSNELFLESLRHSLSMVLSLAQKSSFERNMREELRRLSHRDDLTGVLNRRGLLEQGRVLVRSAQRNGERIGVVLCDLDGLKLINDTHGHADGDLAIRCLARGLEDGFRQSDVVARLGGDEFAVLTVMASDGGLEGAIQRVREALERRSAELGRPWKARTSAGWMAWDPGDGDTLEVALARADQLLYQDKRKRKGTSSGYLLSDNPRSAAT